jgi:multidrug efflux pump subunit AcrB
MWLVDAALRRPYTVWVGMLLVGVLGWVSYQRTPTDILPNLKVPVVVVFASYRGMPAPDMESSVVAPLERALTRCDHLQHIESRSLLGIGIIRIYFRPEADADVAASQVISLVNGEMQNMPPGMLPPSILKYDASAVPVGNLLITSKSRDDKELLDIADHELRDELSGIDGLASAPVFGGVFRQVQIYVHPRTLEAFNLSAADVTRVVFAQSQVIPTGEIRTKEQDYYVSSNSMATSTEDFKKIPVWSDGRKTVYLGDIAEVLDDQRWRTNTVRVDGRRAVYMPLLRQAGASAVRVVDNVQDFLPELHKRGAIPDDVEVEVAFDQAQYVRDALGNLRMEGLCGAVLASLVVLLFLGSLRSFWIVAVTIPLSIFAAFIGLYFTGNTLNIMTLGGLALVLGRLVDDAILDVENTVRHLNMGKTPFQAARDSAREISVPVLMATITTCIVFFPITFMAGMGKYLFTPLAVAACFAMFASYVISRTVSPVCCARFFRQHQEQERLPFWMVALGLVIGLLLTAVGASIWVGCTSGSLPWQALPPLGRKAMIWLYWGGVATTLVGGLIVAILLLLFISPAFKRVFEAFRDLYGWLLGFVIRWRLAVVGVLAALVVLTVFAFQNVGQELFPEVDASEFTIHLRATGGPRVEETERQVAEIEETVREVVPEEDLGLILSNIGISSRWSAIYTTNNGPHAAFIQVQLRSGFAGRTKPTQEYIEELRDKLAERYPSNDFMFETGGMIRRILNSGAVAPIEVQVHGRDFEERRQVTRELDSRISKLALVQDTYQPQGINLPQLKIEVNRERASLVQLTESDVVRNVIIALMSSAQIAPNFWIDPKSGNPYFIGVQFAEHDVDGLRTLESIPITPERRTTAGPYKPRQLKEVADIHRTQAPVEIFRHGGDQISQLYVSVKSTKDVREEEAKREDVTKDVSAKEIKHAHRRGEHQWLRGDDLAGTAADIERIVKEMDLPKGVRVTVQGEVSSMRDSFKEMAWALVLAVVLVYLILAAQFSSWIDPFIIIVAVPLGLIGVVGTLWLTDTSLNIQSCLGVLLMVGISVSNSVLMVEFANHQRQAGMDALSAAISAARTRLRPVLMTTIATIVGLLPMAIHLRPGDEMNLPLARAVIGGLTVSTILTLFVVPVLYALLKRGQVHEDPHAVPLDS